MWKLWNDFALSLLPFSFSLKNVWGEENVPENALSRKSLEPSKRASVLLCGGFLYRKTEPGHLRGVENVPYDGGSKTPFGEGCHSWGFPSPLFSTPPPMASSEIIGNASLFTKFLFTIFVPLNPPPPKPTKWWISFWISIERTSNRIANTQPKLRTNPPKIANKQNYEQTGVSEIMLMNDFWLWAKRMPWFSRWSSRKASPSC